MEIEQTPRRVTDMGFVAQTFREVGATFDTSQFEGPCTSCVEGCGTLREAHDAILVVMDASGLAGWVECPNCRECSNTWGSLVPPERCTWGWNMTDNRDRISNRRCVNVSSDTIYITDDKRPEIRTTLHLCTGHFNWVDSNMELTALPGNIAN